MCGESRVSSRMFLGLHSWNAEGGKAEQKEKSMVLPVETSSQGPRKSIKESRLHPEGPVSHRSVLNTLSIFFPFEIAFIQLLLIKKAKT